MEPSIKGRETSLLTLLNDGNIYEVPEYQRNYAWEQDEIEALWDDLIRTAKGNETYFIGAMVLVRTEYETILEVLDGQQRMATLLLLFAAFRDVIKASDNLNPLLAKFPQILTPLDGTGSYSYENVAHIQLNVEDKAFFNGLIARSELNEPSRLSHKLILSAYTWLKEKVQRELLNWPDAGSFWKALIETLGERLYVIRITVDDEVNAQQVFEALNSAGMDLTEADLIKNYLLRESPPAARSGAASTWRGIVAQVGDTRTTTFIRSFWNSRFSFARKDGLYKALKNKVKKVPDASQDQIDVASFFKEMDQAAEDYSLLRNPSNMSWGTKDHEIRTDLEDLRNLGAELIYVPLLALLQVHRGDWKTFSKTVRWMLDFYVRHSILGGKAANKLETEYSAWAISIRDGSMDLDALYAKLKANSPNNIELLAAIPSRQFKRMQTARVLLARIDDNVNSANNISQAITAGNKIHVEHIIPIDDKLWDTFLKSENLVHEDVVNRFGNMTLLVGPKNVRASNKPFTEKRSAYIADGRPAPINEYLSALSKFGADELKTRSEWLATQAIDVWKLER